jgi:hypothetical protein
VMDYPDLLVEKLTKANVNLKQLSWTVLRFHLCTKGTESFVKRMKAFNLANNLFMPLSFF